MSYEFGHCRPEELSGLIEFCNQVFRSTRPGDMSQEYPLLLAADNLENLLVARHEGGIVAHVGICLRDASILGRGIRVASIGSVGTNPDHRGHGLATRLMANARQQAIDHGASLMLISGGRGLYRRLGYIPAGSFEAYSAPAGEAGEGITLELQSEATLSTVARLYQQEPVRFFRSMDDWHKLMRAGRLLNLPADLLVVHRHGETAAYAAVQHPKVDASGATSPLLIGEFAGSRRALAAALPAIAARYGAPAWELVARSGDTSWSAEATARGWLAQPAEFPGTVGIIDPQQFQRIVEPLLAERVGDAVELVPEGAGASLRIGEHLIQLESMPDLTSLVFGGSLEDAEHAPAIPVGAQGVWEAAFPLPMLWYGYNYV